MDTFTTDEHPYYCRTRGSKWNNERRCAERIFDGPEWVEAKNITRNKGATFYTLDIETDSGMLSIHFIGPKELFDLNLNYVEKL